ncbi:MAG: hypothetical protein E7639_02860 [Ruminococcaceae bacterium]|nr:hypothetical protein [Oscillospiraceae bacterium]
MKAEYRARSLAEALDILRIKAPTLVAFHVRPDADAVGSAFALAMLLRALGSEAYCICSDEIPERLRFLTAGLQESVLPTSVPERLQDARVISVDTASPAQLGALFETLGERVCLMIDHHGTGAPYADHAVIPTAAACAEIVQDLIALSGVTLTGEMATLLYAALAGDTGSFRFSNVTASTHMHAAALIDAGIDVAAISQKLFESKLYQSLLAEKLGFERLQLLEHGKLAVLTFPYALCMEYDLADEHLGTLIDVARCVAGVEIAAAIRGTADGRYRVSLRANGDFDVASVAARFGGGGHRRAAGATLEAENIEVAKRLIVDAAAPLLRGE